MRDFRVESSCRSDKEGNEVVRFKLLWEHYYLALMHVNAVTWRTSLALMPIKSVTSIVTAPPLESQTLNCSTDILYRLLNKRQGYAGNQE